jgi:hypothetical protein
MDSAENGRPSPRTPMQTPIANLIASVLALAAAIALIATPLFEVSSESDTAVGTSTRSTQSITLIEQEGQRILVILAIPVLLTLVPVLASLRHRRAVTIICTSLLAAGVVLALFSVGVFFLPALIAMCVAGVRSAPRPAPVRTGEPAVPG